MRETTLEDAIIENQKRTATLETTNQVLTQKMTDQQKQIEELQESMKK